MRAKSVHPILREQIDAHLPCVPAQIDLRVPDVLRIADTLCATMPNARRVIFDGSGHVVNLEQPARFTREIEDFLRPS